jgi:transposase-like protein
VTASSDTGRKAQLEPQFARELRRVTRRKDDAERAFREVVLRGVSEGMSIAAMAREIDPSGEISRKLLWQWIQAWIRESEGGDA